jgi:hypothetical protein
MVHKINRILDEDLITLVYVRGSLLTFVNMVINIRRLNSTSNYECY